MQILSQCRACQMQPGHDLVASVDAAASRLHNEIACGASCPQCLDTGVLTTGTEAPGYIKKNTQQQAACPLVHIWPLLQPVTSRWNLRITHRAGLICSWHTMTKVVWGARKDARHEGDVVGVHHVAPRAWVGHPPVVPVAQNSLSTNPLRYHSC